MSPAAILRLARTAALAAVRPRPGGLAFVLALVVLGAALPQRPAVSADGATLLERARIVESARRDPTEDKQRAAHRAHVDAVFSAPLALSGLALAWTSETDLPTRRLGKLQVLLAALAVAWMAGAAAACARRRRAFGQDLPAEPGEGPWAFALATTALALAAPLVTSAWLTIGREVYLGAALALALRSAVAVGGASTGLAAALGGLGLALGLGLACLSHPLGPVFAVVGLVLAVLYPRPSIYPIGQVPGRGGLHVRPVHAALGLGLVGVLAALAHVPVDPPMTGARRLVELTAAAWRAPLPPFAWMHTEYRSDTAATVPMWAPALLLVLRAPAPLVLLGLGAALRLVTRRRATAGSLPAAWALAGTCLVCLWRHPYATGVDLVSVLAVLWLPVAGPALVTLPRWLARRLGLRSAIALEAATLAFAATVALPLSLGLLRVGPADRAAASDLAGGVRGLVRWGLPPDPLTCVDAHVRSWLADPELTTAKPSVAILPDRDGHERILKILAAAGELPEGFYTGMPFSTAHLVLRSAPADPATTLLIGAFDGEVPIAEATHDGVRASRLIKQRP